MRVKILIAGIVSILAFSMYYDASYGYYVANNIKTDFTNPLVLWSLFANLIIYSSLAIIYILLGIGQERKIKYLGFYSVAQFWIILILTYLFNLLFDDQTQIHRVYVAVALSLSISLICLTFSSLWYYYKR